MDEKPNQEQDGGKGDNYNPHDLEGHLSVVTVVEKDGLAVLIFRCRGIDKKNNQKLRNETLDEVSPDIRNVLNRGLDPVLERKNVAKGNFPPNGAPGPLAWIFLHLLVEKVPRDGGTKHRAD